MSTQTRRSPLALAILSLLDEEPMHPYRMQQLIKQRGKDDVVNVRARASLYQTIERLLRGGFIAVQETARAENRPERTIYRITDAGRETVREWLRAMIATPAREFPEFPAALAHLPLLAPNEVLPLLQQRLDAVETEIADLEERRRLGETFLPRVVLFEGEYLLAGRRAEAAWLRSAIEDLRTGRLGWSNKQLRELARQTSPERREP